MAGRLLIVDDNEGLRAGLAEALQSAWDSVDAVGDGAVACERLSDPAEPPYDAVLTDLRLPGADGLAVLEAARLRSPATLVLVMSAYGEIDTAVDAMRAGADDFLVKPFDLSQLETRLARASASRAGPVPRDPARPTAAGSQPTPPALVAESDSMREALDLARRVAPIRSTLLLTGETGTGKEIMAAWVHALSDRASGPFVKVNCAALPETLLESELFGHERGAFTGAERQRVGRFEQASGGTLFLDEVGDMSPATQAKLLRVLQEQEFHRLGGTRVLRTDARIVAATNLDLKEVIRDGRFREDLWFRLNVIAIHLPPLRERPEDAVALATRFTAEFARELGRPQLALAAGALQRIREHAWPGNVRELRNAIERAVLLCEGEVIDAAALALGAGAAPLGESSSIRLPPDGVDLKDVERELTLQALARTGFVQKDAAALLGVTRRKLNYLVQKFGIRHPSWRRNRGTPPSA
ncbi:MAG: sigma-54 dependent transcriptional regulator [Proteobacteria bacterium]|nr:sigma-54 dependent transcriptional regulator [Pseudomonadota bacterium]